MQELQIAAWSIRHDPEKTRLLNDAVAASYSAADRLNCSCIRCRNFRAVPGGPYPADFLSLLASFGLGPGDESGVTEAGLMDDGLHFYHGEFEFVGSVLSTPEAPDIEFGRFKVNFAQLPQLIAEGPFAGKPHGLLQFSCRYPWVLEEPYPPPQWEPPGSSS
jgi:hypothetical protein